MRSVDSGTQTDGVDRCAVRNVKAEDLARIISLDRRITGIEKVDYWDDIFDRYGKRRLRERVFLVAESERAGSSEILGYIIGEVRAWEFGSEPCGWVFGFSVDPNAREKGIGEQLFEAISGKFKDLGIGTMRTMVPRSNKLHMAFFRSEGMMAGPYIQLEKDLE